MLDKMILGVMLMTGMAGGALAEPVSLSVAQALGISGALNALDSHDQVIKDGSVEKVVKVPYQLSGQVRLAIAQDLTKLKAVVADFQTARNGKIAELAPDGKTIPPGSDLEQKFGRELTEMLGVKQDLDLTKLSVKDLGLESANNPIPPSVLSELSPLLLDK